jgi:hypothetical protein
MENTKKTNKKEIDFLKISKEEIIKTLNNVGIELQKVLKSYYNNLIDKNLIIEESKITLTVRYGNKILKATRTSSFYVGSIKYYRCVHTLSESSSSGELEIFTPEGTLIRFNPILQIKK